VSDPLEPLRARGREREAAGLRRRLAFRPAGGDGLLDLASNDYLGLSQHPEVTEAAAAAAKEWGAGSTGSRLVTGSTALHGDLERTLAEFAGSGGALVFSSGYLANLGAIAALAGPGDLVVSDAHNHASIVDACRLSRARVAVTPHLDVDAVDAALRDRHELRAIVITDAVFSVDGEAAPLAALREVALRHGALLVVDEAHSLGVVGAEGRGAVHAAGLAGAPDVVVTATLSKALGSQGGAVLAHPDVVDHLVDSARSFIFDTGLAPASAGAALASLRLLGAQPALPTYARQVTRRLAEVARAVGLDPSTPAAAVVGVRIGAPQAAVALAGRLAEHGVRVGCFRPPSVPDGVSRLRLSGRPLGDAAVDAVADAFERAVRAAG
jgi:8-amino-7-oxononanoate synthase